MQHANGQSPRVFPQYSFSCCTCWQSTIRLQANVIHARIRFQAYRLIRLLCHTQKSKLPGRNETVTALHHVSYIMPRGTWQLANRSRAGNGKTTFLIQTEVHLFFFYVHVPCPAFQPSTRSICCNYSSSRPTAYAQYHGHGEHVSGMVCHTQGLAGMRNSNVITSAFHFPGHID